MTKPQKLKEEWTPCPPGTLSSFAGQERFRQRRKFVIRAGSTLGALALASGTGWLVLKEKEVTIEPTFGGIACSKVYELAPQFVAAQLDEVVTQQIKTHLEKCPECRQMMESMRPKTAAGQKHGESTGTCLCATCRRDGLMHVLAQSSSSNVTRTA